MKKLHIYIGMFIGMLNLIPVIAGTITGNYGSGVCPKLYVGLFHHGNYECIDSILVDENGKFMIQLPDNQKGTLLITCPNEQSADMALKNPTNTGSLFFIYDGQDITYETSWRWHNRYLQVSKGGESTKIIKFLYEKQARLHEYLTALETVIEKADDQSAFFQNLIDEYNQSIKTYNKIVCDSLKSAESGTMLEVSIQCLLEPEITAKLHTEEGINQLRLYFFDGIDFCNPLLYNSSIFASRINQYFRIWQSLGADSTENKTLFQQYVVELLKEKVKDCSTDIQIAMEDIIHHNN